MKLQAEEVVLAAQVTAIPTLDEVREQMWEAGYPPDEWHITSTLCVPYYGDNGYKEIPLWRYIVKISKSTIETIEDSEGH